MRHKIAREARRMHCGIHGKGNEKEAVYKRRVDCAFLRNICNATGDIDWGRVMRTASKITTLTIHGFSKHVRTLADTAPARNARSVCLTTCCDHLARDWAHGLEPAHAVVLVEEQAPPSDIRNQSSLNHLAPPD